MASYPNVWVQARAYFDKAQTTQVNQLLGLVHALLTLAIIIARVSIVNTLILSVFERTRETYSPRSGRSPGSPWKPI